MPNNIWDRMRGVAAKELSSCAKFCVNMFSGVFFGGVLVDARNSG